MKLSRVLGAILCVVGLSVAAHAESTSSRLGLTLPDIGSTGWGPKINSNFSIIDSSSVLQSGVNTFTSSNTYNTSVFISSLAVQNFSTSNSSTTVGVIQSLSVSTITAVSSATLTRVSISTAIITNLIGTNTNNNSTTGSVGEYISASAQNQNAGLTTVWTNLTTISLTAGDWNVSGIIELVLNGATITGQPQMAVSLFTGATTTDHVDGDNLLSIDTPTATDTVKAGMVADWRVSVAATTTVYLKTIMFFGPGTPKVYGRISARRMR